MVGQTNGLSSAARRNSARTAVKSSPSRASAKALFSTSTAVGNVPTTAVALPVVVSSTTLTDVLGRELLM